MLLRNSTHLSYCSNIHAGTNWEVTLEELKENVPKIKASFSANTSFGIGLRLSNRASEELGQSKELNDFKNWLTTNGLYVYTLNGFPYGNFHDEKVKDNVHTPDWTTRERVEYTLRLFKQLDVLLPDGIEGGISTSPISYKHWYKEPSEIHKVLKNGAANMIGVALELYQIEQESGNHLHLDIEPEPDGLLENTEEVISFFQDFLIPLGIQAFGELGIPSQKAEVLVKRYIAVCYDVCHFALAYEEPEYTFIAFKNAGIKVGKIQISAALKVLWDQKNKEKIWEALESFNEPTYLHQVTQRVDGSVKTYADLPEVLSKRKDFTELRAHFHVPIFLKQFGLLFSTQDHIVATLEYLKKHPQLTKHLEVETYTWDVLPSELKSPIVDSIIRELNWVKSIME